MDDLLRAVDRGGDRSSHRGVCRDDRDLLKMHNTIIQRKCRGYVCSGWQIGSRIKPFAVVPQMHRFWPLLVRTGSSRGPEWQPNKTFVSSFRFSTTECIIIQARCGRYLREETERDFPTTFATAAEEGPNFIEKRMWEGRGKQKSFLVANEETSPLPTLQSRNEWGGERKKRESLSHN